MLKQFYCTIVNKTQAKKVKNAVCVHAVMSSNHKHSRLHGYSDVSLHILIEICDLNLQSAVGHQRGYSSVLSSLYHELKLTSSA